MCKARASQSGHQFCCHIFNTTAITCALCNVKLVISDVSLPLNLRSPTISREQFWTGLKSHLFKCAYT